MPAHKANVEKAEDDTKDGANALITVGTAICAGVYMMLF